MTVSTMTAFSNAAACWLNGIRGRARTSTIAPAGGGGAGTKAASSTGAAFGLRRRSLMIRGGGATTSRHHDPNPLSDEASFMFQSANTRAWAAPVSITSMSLWRGSLRIEDMIRSTPSSGPSSHWKKRSSSYSISPVTDSTPLRACEASASWCKSSGDSGLTTRLR